MNIGPVHLVSFSSEYYYYVNYGWQQIIRQYEWLERDLAVSAALSAFELALSDVVIASSSFLHKAVTAELHVDCNEVKAHHCHLPSEMIGCKIVYINAIRSFDRKSEISHQFSSKCILNQSSRHVLSYIFCSVIWESCDSSSYFHPLTWSFSHLSRSSRCNQR